MGAKDDSQRSLPLTVASALAVVERAVSSSVGRRRRPGCHADSARCRRVAGCSPTKRRAGVVTPAAPAASLGWPHAASAPHELLARERRLSVYLLSPRARRVCF